MMHNKCIFCGKEISEDYTKEHVIPDFLGGSYSINSVCKKCNNKMGATFENDLTKNTLVSFILSYYLLKNRSGKYYVPRVRLDSNNITTIFKTTDCGNIYMYNYPYDTEKDGKLIKKVDIDEPFNDTVDMFQKKIDRYNLKNDTSIILCNDFKDKIEKAYQEKGKIESQDPADFCWTLESLPLYKLFAKIAYEFAYDCLGPNYLKDSTAISLKNFINDSISISNDLLKINIDVKKLLHCINKVVEVSTINNTHRVNKEDLEFTSNGDYNHSIFLIYIYGKLYVGISLFDLLFESYICVSENPKHYDISDVKTDIKIIKIVAMGNKCNKIFCHVI